MTNERERAIADGLWGYVPQWVFNDMKNRAEAAEKRVAELEQIERNVRHQRNNELDRLDRATALLQRWHSETSIYDKTLVWFALRHDTGAFLSEGKMDIDLREALDRAEEAEKLRDYFANRAGELLNELDDARKVISTLRAWDMVHEPPAGCPEPCGDAPWARRLIDHFLDPK